MNPKLRVDIRDRGYAAVDEARQAGEPPERWTAIDERLDLEDYPC